MALQTFQVPAVGGLDLVSTTQTAAQKPGSAFELLNYEVLPEGGYRKINGYSYLGSLPDFYTDKDPRGFALYEGSVVVIGEYVLHSPDGVSWFVVNKQGATDKTSDELNALDLIPREGSKYVTFQRFTLGSSEVLIITDDVNPPSMLKLENGYYTYEVSTEDDAAGFRHITKYKDHIVLANKSDSVGLVVVSARFAPLDYSGTGSWTVQVPDEVTGVQTFREYLYIFCRNSIYRVTNLESSQNVAVQPVTTNLGCVDGRTIQEIGGDILFLARDGLRYLGATERIDDVNLNISSYLIKSLVDEVDVTKDFVSSVVIPSKAQYRLFYTDITGRRRGLIGTLSQERQFQWSITEDLGVKFIDYGVINSQSVVRHFGSDKIGAHVVYLHDHGSKFDGVPFEARFTTQAFHMGDPAVRKRLHSALVYLEAENTAEVELTITFDYNAPQILQPEPFYLAPVVEAARFGESRYGQATYGAIMYPMDTLFLEGSGKWAQVTFRDSSDSNDPYIIRGFDIQFTTGGRI